MPRGKGGRRRKTRTHVARDGEAAGATVGAGVDGQEVGAGAGQVAGDATSVKVPRSFVVRRGRSGKFLAQLTEDVRRMMEPNTAAHLKDRRNNSVKDYAHVAGPLGVSHLVMFSETELAPYLRMGRLPRGPTLTFQVLSFSLASDVVGVQKRPRVPEGVFRAAPLVVMNGFGGGAKHLQLVTAMVQHMFPAINVHTLSPSACKRVLLFNLDKESGDMDVRHYAIGATRADVNRPLRKMLQRRKLPDLGGAEDVADFMLKGGYFSDSDASDAEGLGDHGRVTLADDYGGRGNRAGRQSVVKLSEIGPRMRLRLVKAEDGLCEGETLYHAYKTKSVEDAAAAKAAMDKREMLRKQRKAEQEANVKRKEEERAEKKRREAERQKRRGDQAERGTKRARREAGEDVSEEDDDAAYYRDAVGEEPDAELFGKGGEKLRPDQKPWRRGGAKDAAKRRDAA